MLRNAACSALLQLVLTIHWQSAVTARPTRVQNDMDLFAPGNDGPDDDCSFEDGLEVIF